MYAEDVGNYWKTSKTSPDTWLAKAKREIARAGGEVLAEAFGSEAGGRSAYMLGFKFNGEQFKVVWPVLPSKGGDDRAARIQAATMLYHDVKARAVSAKVLGVRTAFFSYLMLPDGRTAAQAATPELLDALPKLLTGTV
jgi:hypothetical protein